MIDDDIRHEPEVFPDLANIIPVAQIRANIFIIADGKAVIGCEGEKRQNMHAINDPVQMALQEIQHIEQGAARVGQNCIAIGNQETVGLRPWQFRLVGARACVGGEPESRADFLT